MVFSWLASCAFFVAAENDLVRESQIRSDQYIALQLRIESTREAIAFHERLLEKRLSSAYHSQWKESEANLETIASLKSTLADLTQDSSNVGLEVAAQTVSTTRFFAGIGQVLNIDPQVVRMMGYGILSLLLELSTLGMIGLARTLNSDLGGDCGARGETETVIDNGEYEIEVKKKVAQLTSDILQGRIPPVLRKIKAAHYDLDLDVVRQALRNLLDSGILEQDKRNSYKLGDQFQNIAS